MKAWLSSLPPRDQGAATLLIAASVVVVGLLVARVLGNGFYPVFFPAAGFIVPMGAFQVVTGYSREDMTAKRVPPPIMIFLLVVMAGGALGGLEANRIVFGVRWY